MTDVNDNEKTYYSIQQRMKTSMRKADKTGRRCRIARNFISDQKILRSSTLLARVVTLHLRLMRRGRVPQPNLHRRLWPPPRIPRSGITGS